MSDTSLSPLVNLRSLIPLPQRTPSKSPNPHTPFAFIYPGYFSYKLSSTSINCGHPSPCKFLSILSISGCSAFVKSLYTPVSSPGASAWMSWKMKHSRLLPSARVAPLKTPLVREAGSMPVKELVVPVLPPTERRRGSWLANWRTSRMKLGWVNYVSEVFTELGGLFAFGMWCMTTYLTMPYSSPMARL